MGFPCYRTTTPWTLYYTQQDLSLKNVYKTKLQKLCFQLHYGFVQRSLIDKLGKSKSLVCCQKVGMNAWLNNKQLKTENTTFVKAGYLSRCLRKGESGKDQTLGLFCVHCALCTPTYRYTAYLSHKKCCSRAGSYHKSAEWTFWLSALNENLPKAFQCKSVVTPCNT